eukprot:3687601-Pyramimonas_sp.AAC.1
MKGFAVGVAADVVHLTQNDARPTPAAVGFGKHMLGIAPSCSTPISGVQIKGLIWSPRADR